MNKIMYVYKNIKKDTHVFTFESHLDTWYYIT